MSVRMARSNGVGLDIKLRHSAAIEQVSILMPPLLPCTGQQSRRAARLVKRKPILIIILPPLLRAIIRFSTAGGRLKCAGQVECQTYFCPGFPAPAFDHWFAVLNTGVVQSRISAWIPSASRLLKHLNRQFIGDVKSHAMRVVAFLVSVSTDSANSVARISFRITRAPAATRPLCMRQSPVLVREPLPAPFSQLNQK